MCKEHTESVCIPRAQFNTFIIIYYYTFIIIIYFLPLKFSDCNDRLLTLYERQYKRQTDYLWLYEWRKNTYPISANAHGICS